MWFVAEIEDLGGAVTAQHADSRLGVLPLVDDEVIGERLGLREPAAGLVGDEVRPRARVVEWCSHQAEVGSVEVGEDDEAVAPVVDAVLDVRSARPDERAASLADRRYAARRTRRSSSTTRR